MSQQEVISEPQISTTSQIQDLLKLFVELNGVLHVDDDGYIKERVSEGEDRFVGLKTNKDEEKYIVLYDDNIKNYKEVLVLNPFTESTMLTPDREWFYSKLINNVLSLFSEMLLTQIHEFVIERNDKKSSKKVKETIHDIELLSPFLNLITDKKMLEEFNSIMTNINDGEFLNIYYNRKNMTVKVHCALQNPDLEKAYPNIRKKSWENWKKMLELIYGDLKKNYTIRAELIGCPQLDATMKCWHALFEQAGKYYALIGLKFDNDRLKDHINNLQIYNSKAKWLTQVAVSGKGQTQMTSAPQNTQLQMPAKSTGDNTVVTKNFKVTGVPQPVVQNTPAVPTFAQPINMPPSTLGSTPYGSMALPSLNMNNRVSAPPVYGQPTYGPQPRSILTTRSGMSIDLSK